MAGYEVFHVLPKWPTLVKMPMQQSGTTTGQALGLLATFGAVYNCHRYATHTKVQRVPIHLSLLAA